MGKSQTNGGNFMSLYTKADLNRNNWGNLTKPEKTSEERRVQELTAWTVSEMVNRLLSNQLLNKTTGENYHGDEKQVKAMLDNADVAPRYATMQRVKDAEKLIEQTQKTLESVKNKGAK